MLEIFRVTRDPVTVEQYYNEMYPNGSGKNGPRAMHYQLQDAEATLSPSEAKENLERYVVAMLQLNEGDLIFDIGCGYGTAAIQIATSYPVTVIGGNISPAQASIALKALEGTATLGNVQTVQADFHHHPFPDDQFDGGVVIESACHSPDKRHFLQETARVLRPRARLVVVDTFEGQSFSQPDLQEKIRVMQDGFMMPSFFSESITTILPESLILVEDTDLTQRVLPGIEYSSQRASEKLFKDENLLDIEARFLHACISAYALFTKGAITYKCIVLERV